MGQLINLKCKKCGYETNLGVGVGRMFNKLDAVISSFDKETQSAIRNLIDGGGVSWEAYREIATCERCGKLSAITVFTTSDQNGKSAEYHSKCQCGSADVDLNDYEKVFGGKATITCPACGGYWD